MYRDLIHTETYEGFDINLYFLPEDHPIDWDFDSEEDKERLIADINNGTMLYFCAQVSASKNGIELASDYLGACCYRSANEFIKDGYYQDMRSIAVDQAKEAIKSLCEDNS